MKTIQSLEDLLEGLFCAGAGMISCALFMSLENWPSGWSVSLEEMKFEYGRRLRAEVDCGKPEAPPDLPAQARARSHGLLLYDQRSTYGARVSSGLPPEHGSAGQAELLVLTGGARWHQAAQQHLSTPGVRRTL